MGSEMCIRDRRHSLRHVDTQATGDKSANGFIVYIFVSGLNKLLCKDLPDHSLEGSFAKERREDTPYAIAGMWHSNEVIRIIDETIRCGRCRVQRADGVVREAQLVGLRVSVHHVVPICCRATIQRVTVLTNFTANGPLPCSRSVRGPASKRTEPSSTSTLLEDSQPPRRELAS